jgi:putative endonuclease
VLVSESAGRTYVGVTTDPERRLAEHNGHRPGGARSTRAGRPWSLGPVHGPFEGRGEAQALEHRLRRLRGTARLAPVPADAGLGD